MSATAESRVWGGRTAAEREGRRREQFIDAGLEVFARDGWDSATVAGLCRAAKLSQRYFYEAFPSREALFLAVLNQIAADITTVALAAVEGEGEGSPAERARAVLTAVGDYAAADPRRVRVALVESHGTAQLRTARGQLLAAFSDVAARLMRGFSPDADVDRLAASARVLSGGLAEVLARGEPLDADHLADLYAAAASACV